MEEGEQRRRKLILAEWKSLEKTNIFARSPFSPQ
jgi:hypothetical protein